MATAQIIPLFSIGANTARVVAAQPAPTAEPSREMVTAALQSWMDGDPLTAREQRIVDLVIDTNYFGQLGHLAMGA